MTKPFELSPADLETHLEAMQHKHSITDFPTGQGSGQVPLSSSLRTNLLDVLSVNSGAVANTAVLTPFSGTGAYTLPANAQRVGELLRVHAKGTFGITGTPTLLLRADFGGLNRIPGVAVTVNAAGVWELFLDVVALEGGLARMSGKIIIPTSTTAASVQEFRGSTPRSRTRSRSRLSGVRPTRRTPRPWCTAPSLARPCSAPNGLAHLRMLCNMASGGAHEPRAERTHRG